MRELGHRTTSDVASAVTRSSVICLPIGSFEQHGPHLPLNTDTIIAEGFTRELLAKYGELHDLWALPAISYGFAPEHSWAPGTVTLPLSVVEALVRAVVLSIAKALSARSFVIVNGHGGNRSVLESVARDLKCIEGLNICILHTLALTNIDPSSSTGEIHAGRLETSVMQALAPSLVHLERLPPSFDERAIAESEVRDVVQDRAVTWPWTSDDARISRCGIIGTDPRSASAESGRAALDSALVRCGPILRRLYDGE